MSEREIDYQETDGIAEITICRPHKRNALTPQMFVDLRAAWDRFDQGQARVAVLKSCDDRVFSAGADLTDPPELFWQGVPEFGFRCDKPIIAAVSGKAIGIGVVLALMCDFVVVAEGAELIYPEARVGVAKGGVTALVRRAPLRVALEMMLLGDPISARRAYETGMANRLTPPGGHIEEARKLARRLADNAPLVVSMLKRMSLEATGDVPIQTMFDVTRKVDRVMNSHDAEEALDAFRNKRPPVFRGR